MGRYRELTESISDVFFAMDKDFRYTYWNKASERLTGLSAKNAIGKSLTEVFPDVKGTKVEQFYSEVLRTKQHQTLVNEYRIGDKDFAFEIDAYPTENGLSVFVKDITERKKAESERTRLLHDLDERAKELRCLYGISKLVEKPDISLDEIMQETTNLLPPAWQYPDITCARIVFENQEFRTENFKATQWRQCSDIEVNGKKVGFVEICYLEEKPTITEGSFLKEERDLINAVTGRLGKIIERNEAEGKVETERRKLRDIIEDMADSVCVTDLDQKIIMVNKAMVDLFQVSREKLLTLKGFDLATKEDMPRISKAMQDLFKTGLPQNVEVTGRLSGAKGKPFWIRFSLLKDEKGRPTGIVTVTRDLTERKRAQEKLQESEEKYRSMVELAPVAISTLDLKGVVTSCNTFTTISGYSKDEIIGKHFSKIGWVRLRDLPQYLKIFNSIIRGKVPQPFDISYRHKDGELRGGRVYVSLMKRRGKTIGLHTILMDITELKKKEKMIRESQEKFERLFMNNPEAAVYVDSSFHVLDINPRFTALFGYSLDEVRGKHINQVVVQEDKIAEAENLNTKAEKGYVYHDTLRKRKDGKLIPVSISAAPIIIEGKHVGNVGVYTDISQLKRAENTLKEELEKSAVLNEKLSVVGRLTRHDARNKLSIVTMNIFLTKQKLAGNNEALQYLSEIESAVKQTERIFDFAGIYEKLGMEELAHVDVEKCLREAVMSFSDLHDVEVVNGCHGLTVLADSLLRQLFYNLVDNSLKHGEKVSQIRVCCKEAGKDKLKLVYEDDGVGIPKAEKEKIFMEGYGKGTGYGLYLIRKMCEVYGWSIRETGKHGRGAQFTIMIPKELARIKV